MPLLHDPVVTLEEVRLKRISLASHDIVVAIRIDNPKISSISDKPLIAFDFRNLDPIKYCFFPPKPCSKNFNRDNDPDQKPIPDQPDPDEKISSRPYLKFFIRTLLEKNRAELA